jgi:ABC-2 type transport system ATP-binding protein
MREVPATKLHVQGVRKTYPNGIEAVRGLSLEVHPGEVFGLVGPNGAGKTTLLKIISGLLYPEEGRVLCNGTDVTSRPQRAAQYVGLMPDPLGVYTDLSALEYLQFFGRILDLSAVEIDARVREAVRLLELERWLDEEVETLSAGWQRRLALGRILLADAPILLLDEPAAGLDISSRSELLRLVKNLAAGRRTIVISSHILPELQELADRFGIINDGRWVAVDEENEFFTREQLEHGFGTHEWRMRCNNAKRARSVLLKLRLTPTDSPRGGIVFRAATEEDGAAALKAVIRAGVAVYEFRQSTLDLSRTVLDVLSKEESP